MANKQLMCRCGSCGGLMKPFDYIFANESKTNDEDTLARHMFSYRNNDLVYILICAGCVWFHNSKKLWLGIIHDDSFTYPDHMKAVVYNGSESLVNSVSIIPHIDCERLHTNDILPIIGTILCLLKEHNIDCLYPRDHTIFIISNNEIYYSIDYSKRNTTLYCRSCGSYRVDNRISIFDLLNPQSMSELVDDILFVKRLNYEQQMQNMLRRD